VGSGAADGLGEPCHREGGNLARLVSGSYPDQTGRLAFSRQVGSGNCGCRNSAGCGSTANPVRSPPDRHSDHCQNQPTSGRQWLGAPRRRDTTTRPTSPGLPHFGASRPNTHTSHRTHQLQLRKSSNKLSGPVATPAWRHTRLQSIAMFCPAGNVRRNLKGPTRERNRWGLWVRLEIQM
jgi:hypothetical protein